MKLYVILGADDKPLRGGGYGTAARVRAFTNLGDAKRSRSQLGRRDARVVEFVPAEEAE